MGKRAETQPVIGLAGCVLTLLLCPAGVVMAANNNAVSICLGVVVMSVGPAVLVYALVTGKITLFG